MRLLKKLKDKYGSGVMEITDQDNREDTVSAFKEIAEEKDKVTIDSFCNMLWEEWCRPDCLEFTYEKTENETKIKCTYCPWVEIAKELGAEEMAFQLICQGDYYMVEGFNQGRSKNERPFVFSREHTLMQGHAFCDHTYTYKDE